MNNIQNDRNERAKAKNALTLNKVKPIAIPKSKTKANKKNTANMKPHS